MVYFLDVGACVCHRGGDARQHAGHIACADLDARQAPRAHHAALDDGRQQQRVDVAAAQHQAHALALEAFGVAQQRCQPCGARAFHQGFLNFEQHQHGLLNVALVHQHQVIHQALDDFLRDLARRAHGNALGDG